MHSPCPAELSVHLCLARNAKKGQYANHSRDELQANLNVHFHTIILNLELKTPTNLRLSTF